MANYVDDCSPMNLVVLLMKVILKSQHDPLRLIEWYESNYLKPNPDQWHLLLSDKGDNYSINIGNDFISNSTGEKKKV